MRLVPLKSYQQDQDQDLLHLGLMNETKNKTENKTVLNFTLRTRLNFLKYQKQARNQDYKIEIKPTMVQKFTRDGDKTKSLVYFSLEPKMRQRLSSISGAAPVGLCEKVKKSNCLLK